MRTGTFQSKIVGLALAGLVAAGTLGLAAATARGASSAKSATDLSGTWRIDRKASDRPGGPGGFRGGMGGPGMERGGMGGGRHGGGPGGGGGGYDRPGGGRTGGPSPGPDGAEGERSGRGLGRLGPYLRIEQSPVYVHIADSTGTTVREIVLGNGAKGNDANGDPIAVGSWKGSKLEVVATGPGGRMRVETWALEDGGKTLTITTKFEAQDDRPAREMKRVYRRAAA